MNGFELNAIAIAEFLLVGKGIKKSQKGFEDGFGLVSIFQEILVKFGCLSFGVVGRC